MKVGTEKRIRFIRNVPVKESLYKAVILDSSSEIAFSEVFLHAKARGEEFGFLQLFFKCVWCLGSLIVAIFVVSRYLLKTREEIPYLQKSILALTLALPFYINPVYIFTMQYNTSPT